MSTCRLLVEGSGDQAFFRALLKSMGYDHVEVYPPKSVGAKSDGINNLITILPEQLDQIRDDINNKLGIVFDADYSGNEKNNNFGYDARRKTITDIFIEKEYIVTNNKNESKLKGEIFAHSDGLSPIGIWIMPDHFSDGMIEDFWLSSIADGIRKNLLTAHVDESIAAICTDEQLKEKNILFFQKHLAKVRFDTWLRWQKKPSVNKKNKAHECYRSLTPACALKEGWFKPDHDNIVAIKKWLENVFQKPSE